jgi:hypothetical protein
VSKPAFLVASQEDVKAWRTSTITQAFLDWIDWEASKAKDAIATHVMEGRQGSARVLAGRLSALGEIARCCEVPAELPEVKEEVFHDPAERRSQTHRAEVSDDL